MRTTDLMELNDQAIIDTEGGLLFDLIEKAQLECATLYANTETTTA